MLRNCCEWAVMVISLRRPVDRSLLHVGKCIQIRCLAIFSSLLEVFPFYRFHQMRSKSMVSRMFLFFGSKSRYWSQISQCFIFSFYFV